MKWEARKIGDDKWGVFLMQEFCRTDEPVCYSTASGLNAESVTKMSVERLNKSEEIDGCADDKAG